MLGVLLLGSGLAFAAVIQPGPLQAFLLARATAEGWKRTLPAALSPLLSDGPIALLVLLVLGRIPAPAQHALRAAGGLLLLFLAWSAARSLRADRATPAPSRDPVPRTLLQAASVNLLNPNPWFAWTLVLGPTVVSAWKEGPILAVAFVTAFYGVMVTGLGLFILVASTARFLPPRAQRALVGLSAIALAALGTWQLFAGLRAIVRV